MTPRWQRHRRHRGAAALITLAFIWSLTHDAAAAAASLCAAAAATSGAVVLSTCMSLVRPLHTERKDVAAAPCQRVFCRMDIPEFIKNIDMDLLISLVRERPVLWDKSLEEFKYKNITNGAWKDICLILYSDFDTLCDKDKDIFGKSVFKKWKNVKDNFFKYLTKIKSKRSGSAASGIKKYHYFEQLSFLRKIAPAETQSSIATNSATQNQEESSEQSREESSNEQQASINNNEPTTSNTSRRKRKSDEFETEVLNILKTDKLEKGNRHLLFFKSILPSLEKFNDQQVLQFQSRVLQIITDIQYPTSVWQNTFNYGYQTGDNTSTYDSYQTTPTTSSLSHITSPTQITSPMSDETLPDFN